MGFTTIQLDDRIKEKLEHKKLHPKESYNKVLSRLLENEQIPNMEEMFKKSKEIKQKRKYTTQEIINLSHSLRG